jgi:hypothetical protein
MDVHAVWLVTRRVGVAVVLLACTVPYQGGVQPALTAADMWHEMNADLLRQVPHPMSIDKVFATLGR